MFNIYFNDEYKLINNIQIMGLQCLSMRIDLNVNIFTLIWAVVLYMAICDITVANVTKT